MTLPLTSSFETQLADAASSRNAARYLELVVAQFRMSGGTIHRLEGDTLHLVTQIGMPEHLVPIISHIPVGKGLAGLAAEQKRAVTVCNLQSDDTGRARPAAKGTGMQATIACPIIIDDQVRGVFGVGSSEERTWSAEDESVFQALANGAYPMIG